MTVSTTTLSITTLYRERAIMLSVKIYLLLHGVVILNVAMLNLIRLNVMGPLVHNSVGVFSSVKRSSLFFSSPSNDIDTYKTSKGALAPKS